MSDVLISITDAASISGKSIQTIRRAIKAKKIKVRKQKTPQGFNYLIVRDTLISCYQVKEADALREIPIERESENATSESVIHDGMGTVHLDISETKELDTLEHAEEIKNALLAHGKAQERAQAAIAVLDEKISDVVNKHNGEREQVTQVLTEFKDRILILENQIRLLQAPKKKWFQLWK